MHWRAVKAQRMKTTARPSTMPRKDSTLAAEIFTSIVGSCEGAGVGNSEGRGVGSGLGTGLGGREGLGVGTWEGPGDGLEGPFEGS